MTRAWILVLLLGCRQVLGIESGVVVDASGSDASTELDAIDAAPDAQNGTRLEFTGHASSTLDQASWDFLDVPIGPPAPDRVLLIVSQARGLTGGSGVATIKVNTLDAVKIAAVNEGTIGGSSTTLHLIAAPTGTTATISAIWTNAGAGDRRAEIAVWAAYGLESTTPTTVVMANMQSPATVDVNVLDGGFAISAFSIGAIMDGTTSTWTNVSPDYTDVIETTLFSGASRVGVAGLLTITHVCSQTTETHRLLAASFR